MKEENEFQYLFCLRRESLLDERMIMKAKKWLVLDAMGVVFVNEDDVEELLIPFLKKKVCNLDVKKLKDYYYNHASLGKISSKEFFKQLNVPDVEKEYLDECLQIDPDFLSVAGELKENYVLALFSNDVSEWSKYLRQKYDLVRFFSKYVISGDVGLKKPAPRFYKKLLEEIGANGEQCIFVDDSLRNLEPALKYGITTVHFQRSKPNFKYGPDYIVKDFFELRDLLLI
jgi:putative hydrolase of the HAD superfamily